MEISRAFAAIDRSLVDVAKSINVLSYPPEEKPRKYLRLEDSAYVLTEEVKTMCQVVTAHNLQQYRNEFHSIKLEDDVTCWLDYLLEENEE